MYIFFLGVLLGYFSPTLYSYISRKTNLFIYFRLFISLIISLYNSFSKSKPNVTINNDLAHIECILPNGSKGILTVPLIKIPFNRKVEIKDYHILEYRNNDHNHIIGLPVSSNHAKTDKLDIKIKSYPDPEEHENSFIYEGEEMIEWNNIINSKKMTQEKLNDILEAYD